MRYDQESTSMREASKRTMKNGPNNGENQGFTQ